MHLLLMIYTAAVRYLSEEWNHDNLNSLVLALLSGIQIINLYGGLKPVHNMTVDFHFICFIYSTIPSSNV